MTSYLDSGSQFRAFAVLSILLFMTTTFQSFDLLGLQNARRAISLFLIALFFYHMSPGKTGSYNKGLVLAATLILLGYSINILRSLVFFGASTSYLGLLFFPMFLFTLPFIGRFTANSIGLVWSYYGVMMLVVSILSIAEFFLVQAGLIGTKYVTLSGGKFLAGHLTIFHALDSGEVYQRMYGVFAEPGTMAMFCVCAICYFLVMHRYLMAIPLILAVLLTTSLGGIISLGIALILHFVPRLKERVGWPLAIFILLVPMIACGWIATEVFTNALSAKGLSFTIRAENFWNSISALPVSIIESPLGLPLTGTSLSQNESKNYVGSNFSFFTVFTLGGVLALVGYMFLVLQLISVSWANIGKKHLVGPLHAAHLSILSCFPFIFQRTTPFETVSGVFLWYIILTVPYLYVRPKKPAKIAASQSSTSQKS